jgi:hypothetical protein
MSERPSEDRTLASFDGTGDSSTTEARGSVDDPATAEVRRVPSQQGNNEYGTPRWLVRRLTDAIGGRFGLNPAAGAGSPYS